MAWATFLMDSSVCCIIKYEPRETMYRRNPGILGPNHVMLRNSRVVVVLTVLQRLDAPNQ